MRVRDAAPEDLAVWAAMRARLWTDAEPVDLANELPAMLDDPALWNFMLLDAGDRVIGFAEVQLRTMFDGCPVAPYPHIEGIWVEAAHRRPGGARRLLDAIEARAREREHGRIGSDVEIDNLGSQAWHDACGFVEEVRVVLYSKPL